jgi:hypothetical protein
VQRRKHLTRDPPLQSSAHPKDLFERSQSGSKSYFGAGGPGSVRVTRPSLRSVSDSHRLDGGLASCQGERLGSGLKLEANGTHTAGAALYDMDQKRQVGTLRWRAGAPC